MPTDITPPGENEGDYAFHVIRIRPGGKVEFDRTCRLILEDSYLSQLSDT